MAGAAWVALGLIHGIGGRTFSALLDVFGSPEAVFNATERQLLAIKGVGEKTAASIKATDLPRISDSLDQWQKSGVRVLDWDAPDYPAPLRGLHDAPPTLFVKGRWPVLPPRAVAIVGTRYPSPAAKYIARRFSKALADEGIAVVSGLALGTDAAGHHAALDSSRGVTVAVLGSGVLNVYPDENRELARNIEQYGALVCEVRPDAKVSAAGLVSRNRLISGLCEAVVIVQTDADGGALYAAKSAARQGRKVFFIDDPLGNPGAARGIDVLRDSGATPLPPTVSGLDWLI